MSFGVGKFKKVHISLGRINRHPHPDDCQPQRRLQTQRAAGSVPAFCPGSTFTPSGYTSKLANPYVLLQVIHHARNNLSADLKVQASLLDKSDSGPYQ